MDLITLQSAQGYLESCHRIQRLEERTKYQEDVLLLPQHIGLQLHSNHNVRTVGMDEALDQKQKDLLRIIEIEDALHGVYRETNVLSPSVYVHGLPDVPYHIATQGFLVSRLSAPIIAWMKEEQAARKAEYGLHPIDAFWLPFSRPLESMQPGDVVCIFNRRVGGWDGSPALPVIELLGAGGHLQSVWDNTQSRFISRTLEDNLHKEFSEEIGHRIKAQDITFIGGFENIATHELVLFSCIDVPDTGIPHIQEYALHNIQEDTNGIHLGTFDETMGYYQKHPQHFAGGLHAAATNFPNNRQLMHKLQHYMQSLQ